MPDPNKRQPRLKSRVQTDASKTPKVRKDPKFIGTQRYGREFMNKLAHNQMTSDTVGKKKFKREADAQGQFVKANRFNPRGRFPTQGEMYKGGMHGPGNRVAIGKNLSRGS